jgi:hypothetical protein
LLGETYHNFPKTYKSDKQSILLQNFVGTTYKLKNKGVGVPSSYLSNCIRLGLVALFSWPSTSSKVATANNNSKGILSTLESFKHPTFDNGGETEATIGQQQTLHPIKVNHLVGHPNLEH